MKVCTPIYESLSVKRKFIESTYLWHLRLRHINLYRIKRLVHNGPLDAIKVEPYPTCESCLMGKMTKTPFPKKDERANDKLQLMHTDVCGQIDVAARGGYRYFITFTYDHSKYGYVYLMSQKS